MIDVEFRVIVKRAGTLVRHTSLPFMPVVGLELIRPDQGEGAVHRVGWDVIGKRAIAWLKEIDVPNPHEFVNAYTGWGWEFHTDRNR